MGSLQKVEEAEEHLRLKPEGLQERCSALVSGRAPGDDHRATPGSARDMKKDLPRTQNNAQGHQKHGKDDDTGQTTKDNGSRQPTQAIGSRHPTKDNDNDGSQLTKYNDTKQDNDNKPVQETQDIKTDSRHLKQVKTYGKQTKDSKYSRKKTQDEENTNSNLTTQNRPIESSLIKRRLERLQDNETITEEQKQYKPCKKTSKTKEQKEYEMHEKKICTIRKIIMYIQILMSNWLIPKRKKKKPKQCSRFGEKFKVFFTLLIFIPTGHSSIIRDSKIERTNTNNLEKLLSLTETIKNNGDIDNDYITTN